MRGKFRIKSSSLLATAAALGLAVSGFGLSTVPAEAKNSREFVTAAKPLQGKIEDLDKLKKSGSATQEQLNAAVIETTPMLNQAIAAASTDQDKLAAGQFALNLGGINDDVAMRQRGIQMMLDSGLLEEEQIPTFQFYLGNFAYGAKDFQTASAALKTAAMAGYEHEALVPLLLESYKGAGKTAEGLATLRTMIDNRLAAGQSVPESWLSDGNSAAYKANAGQDAIYFSNILVDHYPTNFNWLGAAQVVRNFGGFDKQATLDLFRLMAHTGALNNERKWTLAEYKEYIETAIPIKRSAEVLKVIEIGRNAGILEASDTWVDEARQIASDRYQQDKPGNTAYYKGARAYSDADRIYTAADIALSYGDFAEAEALYELSLQKGGTSTNAALMGLGIAQYEQGKYVEAKANFGKVAGPSKNVANLWRIHIDNKTAASAQQAQPTTKPAA